MKSAQISGIQLFMLIIGFTFGSTAILNPAADAYHDAWLSYLLGWVGGCISITVFCWISRLNPEKTLVEILKSQFGKVGGSIIAVFYIWYFIHLAALVIRNFGEYMTTTSYTETPIIFIIICFIAVVVYGMKKGLEVMVRPSEILVPVVIFFVLFLGVALIKKYNYANFLPFLEKGIKPILKSSFAVWTFPFGETVAFLMIFPFLNQKKKLFKISFLAIVVAGFVIFLIVVRDLLVLGTGMMMPKRLIFPPNTSAALISEKLQLQTLISANFLIGGGIKISVCLFAAVLGITQLFNLDDFKPLISPVAALAVALSIWVYPNIFEMLRWAAEVWPYYSIPFQIIFPLLLLIMSLIKYKKIKNNSE